MDHYRHREWHSKNYGTEDVAPFLQSLIALSRPQRILEIGVGYTTPFLVEGIERNKDMIFDRNTDREYLDKIHNPNNPKMVIIDDYSSGVSASGNVDNIQYLLSKCDYVELVNGKFQGKANDLHQKYGTFDFVWFDCGGPEEYESFIKEYWDICSDYVIFHFTYTYNKPNIMLETILKNVKGTYFRMDIQEPHKWRQSGLTVLRKAPVPQVGDSFYSEGIEEWG